MAKTPPIAPDKLAWAQARDKTTLLGIRLEYNVSNQQRYTRALLDLVRIMSKKMEIAIKELFDSNAAITHSENQNQLTSFDDSITSAAKKLMNRVSEQFTQLFSSKALGLSEKMVDQTNKTSSSNLQMSLKQLSGGLTLDTRKMSSGLKEIIKATTAENVALIKSIPQKYLIDVNTAVMRSITTNTGYAQLLKQIRSYNAISERRVKNLALDQTRKAYNNINKQKMLSSGIKKYKWLHSAGGQKPRKDHIAMSGNIYSFDDPPIIVHATKTQPEQRGIPGQAINCRCVMLPVIEFEDGEFDGF